MTVQLRVAARDALELATPSAKIEAVAALQRCAMESALTINSAVELRAPDLPGQPPHLVLVHPARVPRRRLGTLAGRAALIHALAHIEFNAVNLALDAVVRFANLPRAYYFDWLHVAAEEAHHFSLLVAHLATLGAAYGDFPVHGGLWEAATKTRDDVLARMALVPRILEARGLDVTPALQQRLAAVHDHAAVAILETVLRDEIGHVAIGNRWYEYLCAERGLDPMAAFPRLCVEYGIKPPHPPFNDEARQAAGFSALELAQMRQRAESEVR